MKAATAIFLTIFALTIVCLSISTAAYPNPESEKEPYSYPGPYRPYSHTGYKKTFKIQNPYLQLQENYGHWLRAWLLNGVKSDTRFSSNAHKHFAGHISGFKKGIGHGGGIKEFIGHDSGIKGGIGHGSGIKGSFGHDSGITKGIRYDSGIKEGIGHEGAIKEVIGHDSGIIEGIEHSSGIKGGLGHDSGITGGNGYDSGIKESVDHVGDIKGDIKHVSDIHDKFFDQGVTKAPEIDIRIGSNKHEDSLTS